MFCNEKNFRSGKKAFVKYIVDYCSYMYIDQHKKVSCKGTRNMDFQGSTLSKHKKRNRFNLSNKCMLYKLHYVNCCCCTIHVRNPNDDQLLL